MGEKYDLVEKLRSLYFADEALLEEAADRIEQLVATCEELEAKLAEVVAVGVRVRDYFTHHRNKDVYALHDFYEAIAYLKGQKDGWKCPINHPNCEENCGNYGCGN